MNAYGDVNKIKTRGTKGLQKLSVVNFAASKKSRPRYIDFTKITSHFFRDSV